MEDTESKLEEVVSICNKIEKVEETITQLMSSLSYSDDDMEAEFDKRGEWHNKKVCIIKELKGCIALQVDGGSSVASKKIQLSVTNWIIMYDYQC